MKKKLQPLTLDKAVPVNWSSDTCLDNPDCKKLKITKGLLELFDEPELKTIVVEALSHNQNLLATAMRLEASGYLLRSVKMNGLPELNGEASAGRNNQGVDTVAGGRKTDNNFRVSLGLSWEIDLWGRIADQKMAERWQHEALKEDYERARDALAARVIQAFIQTVAAEKAVEIDKKRLEILNANKNLIVQKYRKGLGTMDGISSANTNIHIAEAELSRRNETCDEFIRELEVLAGRFPERKLIVKSRMPQIKYPEIALPETVLMNRPDVRSALMAVEAGKNLVKVSEKRRLPSIVLTADLFKAAGSTVALWHSQKNWGLIGNITQPLFNWGKLKNEAAAQQKEADARVADLYDTVINAIKEVETVLGREKYLEVQSMAYANAVGEAVKNRKYFEKRYMTGLDTMTSLLVAQEQEMSVRQSFIETEAARMSNRVDLALATGTGVYQ